MTPSIPTSASGQVIRDQIGESETINGTAARIVWWVPSTKWIYWIDSKYRDRSSIKDLVVVHFGSPNFKGEWFQGTLSALATIMHLRWTPPFQGWGRKWIQVLKPESISSASNINKQCGRRWEWRNDDDFLEQQSILSISMRINPIYNDVYSKCRWQIVWSIAYRSTIYHCWILRRQGSQGGEVRPRLMNWEMYHPICR